METGAAREWRNSRLACKKLHLYYTTRTGRAQAAEREKRMDEMMKPETGLTPLSMLAEEARIYSENIIMNTLNLGRVLTEAKQQVGHGEWGDWVAMHAGMSVRSAQQFMQAYSRFGGKPAFALVDKSKLYKMLALPEGTEDSFIEEHDVSAMTSREVEEAVRQVKEEAKREREEAVRQAKEAAQAEHAEALRQAQEEAERTLKESVKRAYEETREEHESDLKRAVNAARALEGEKKAREEAEAARQAAEKETRRLQQEIDENNELLEDMQTECNRAQTELLNLQSQLAKGDAERMPGDELTQEVFASAVRQFIGACARMPQMGNTFAEMPTEAHRHFDELLKTIEAWARDARRALDTTDMEAEVR